MRATSLSAFGPKAPAKTDLGIGWDPSGRAVHCRAGMSTAAQEPVLLLTVGEAGRRLGLSERHTWKLVSRGELEVVRLGTKATRVIASTLNDYIERLRATSVPGGSDTT